MPPIAGPSVSRRGFLRGGARAVLMLVSGLVATGCRSANPDPLLANPALLDALGAARVRRLGEMWRASNPGERTAASLTTAITRRLDGAITGDTLAAAIRMDFTESRIVHVDGWILAVTEARQCALFSLATA